MDKIELVKRKIHLDKCRGIFHQNSDSEKLGNYLALENRMTKSAGYQYSRITKAVNA